MDNRKIAIPDINSNSTKLKETIIFNTNKNIKTEKGNTQFSYNDRLRLIIFANDELNRRRDRYLTIAIVFLTIVSLGLSVYSFNNDSNKNEEESFKYETTIVELNKINNSIQKVNKDNDSLMKIVNSLKNKMLKVSQEIKEIETKSTLKSK